MVMNKESQHFINSIPGVTRFIGGTPLKPEPINREEVDRILGRISAPDEARTTSTFRTTWATASRSWTARSRSGSA